MAKGPARSIWTGAISFGIVNIPIRLMPAVREHQLHFHQISRKQKARIRHKLVAEGSDSVVPAADIVRAFEIQPDTYVTIEDEELRQLAAQTSHTIDIVDFVGLEEIDPLYFDAAYWMVPDERSTRPYRLLCEAMSSSGRVAIARFVMRTKEVLASIRALQNGLCLETLHYHDEIVAYEDVAAGAKMEKPQERELTVAKQIIDSLTTSFAADRYRDDYRDRLMAFLEKKAKGHTETIATEQTEKPGKILDLMAALEQSLGQVRSQRQGADHPKHSKLNPANRRASRPLHHPPRLHGKKAS